MGDAPSACIDPDASKGWFQRLLPLLQAHWVMAGASLLAGGLMISAGIAVPRLVMKLIDEALTTQESEIAPLAWLLAGLALIRAIGSMGFRFGIQKVAQLLEYDLRTGIYEHLAGLSFGFYDRVQTGQLISRANADIRAIQMFLAMSPLMAVTLFSFVGSLTIMLTIHPLLTLVALVPIPGIYLMGLQMRGKLFPISWVISARQAEIATLVEENVTGVRIVKSFAAEGQQVGALARVAERLRYVTLLQVQIRAWFGPVMENLPRVGRALVLLYGGWLAIEGHVTIGALVAINMYMIGLQAPFRIIGFLMIMSQRAAASAGRIYAIFDEETEVLEKDDALDLKIEGARIEFDRVTFGYAKGKPVLRDLSLVIEPGETVAIVGRTGCGKSTLMRLLPRFYDVREGAVRIDGVDVRDATLASLRRQIGMVLDEPFLFSESIHDNIAYARPWVSRDEVVRAAKLADADRFVLELPEGYDTVIGERGYTLSGGQRQRIAIARTLVADPKILILDDATSSLDVRVEQQIHASLKKLFVGRTTIVIAHRLSTIALAERVLLLDEGRIVADGSHRELLRTVPGYAAILTRKEDREANLDTSPSNRVAQEMGR